MKFALPSIALACAVSFIFAPVYAASAQLGNKEKLMAANVAEYSYSLALQAAEWGLPIVIMYNLRYNDALQTDPKAKPNEIWRLEDITTPALAEKAGYVTPNVNVIYGFGFLDLSKEPIILSAPDSNNRYYMIQLVDMYTNSFAYIGGVATGYKGGKFALVGPGWQGTLPPDVTRIDAPTPWILIQPRVHVLDEADLPAAKKILEDITVTGLAKSQGQTPVAATTYNYIAPDLINPKLPVSAVDFKDPLQFWKILSAAINENPPPKDQIQALLPMFKMLGIEYGKQWDPSTISPIILDSMKRAALKVGPLNSNLPVGTFVNNWYLPPPAIGDAKNNYYLNAIVARVGLTANTPEEAIYFMSTTDSHSQDLMSNKKYTLTFKQLPPYIAPGFWSLTLYNQNNNYNVENPIHRYSLGSDNQMKMNADGSLTIYVQSTSPGKDKEANWLPSGDSVQPIYFILRSYAPGQAMIDALSNPKLFTPPAAIEVK
jgi:hypothetical protein